MDDYGSRLVDLKDEEILLSNRPPVPGEYGHPLPRELMYRELGLNNLRYSIGKKILSDTLATTADYNLITRKTIKKTRFLLPPGARTTFHMAFSTDGTLVASCHGDHNVYVCHVSSGKVVRTLTGHPRTPWCVVFHPTQNDILASGCLAGHVRVWDLKGGSELLVTDSGTVIASLAFHPSVRLLAIGTFNEVIFWDWNRSVPLARCSTENTKEKVRLVRFDRLGKSLITGITNFPTAPTQQPSQLQSRQQPTTNVFRPNILRISNNNRSIVPPPTSTTTGELNEEEGLMFVDDDEEEDNNNNNNNNAPTADDDEDEDDDRQQDRFHEGYRQLVSHYEDLVQHYHTFLRSRIPRLLDDNEITPPPPPPPPPPLSSQPTEQQPIINDDEQQPGPSRLMRNTTTTTPENRQFSSIEALAQNILEMQNLCSEARQRVRLAPLTVETQHVVELQHIRQHLEVLQDQTRRLQSSIRATLTSLATGSLAALNPILLRDNNTTEDEQNTPLTPLTPLITNNNTTPVSSSQQTLLLTTPNLSPGTSQLSQQQAHSSSSPTSSTVGQSITTTPRRSISPSMSNNSSTFFRISIGQTSQENRMRVPPIVRYNESTESSSLSSEPRRIFHVIPQRTWTEEHSRNCPFNNNLHPPPRMRCLTELGEPPLLTVWPTIETGMARATRLFPQDDNTVLNLPSQTAVETIPLLQPTINAFHHWLSSSNTNLQVPNDLGVRVFLTVRQQQTESPSDNENWQRSFLSGLALVPTSVREGRRTNTLQIPGPSSNLYNNTTSRRTATATTRRAQWVCQLGRQQQEQSRSPLPSRLNSNFLRVFYIRSQDELIPVYSNSSPDQPAASPNDIRDSLNVFMFPVGLLLQGNYETQTVGIYQPPLTHQEDESLTEYRRTEALIPVVSSGVRIIYDNNSMQIVLNGSSSVLTFVQPGLPILLHCTTFGNLPRPRPTEGIIYVEFITPLLDSIERFFGQRHRHTQQPILNLSNQTRRPVNPRRIITFAQDAPDYDQQLNNNNRRSNLLQRDFFHHGPPQQSQQDYHHHHHHHNSHQRRVISLAVDAAASELLRRNVADNESVESRIERVLNERGNRGDSNNSDEADRSRLEDIQRRISMLAQWSRARNNNNNSSGGGGGGAPPGPTRRRPFIPSNQDFSSQGQGGGPMDHWVIRRQRRLTNNTTTNTAPRYNNSDGTSARTRANRIIDLPTTSRITFPPQPPIAHQYNNTNNNTNNNNDEGDPAARFYPGYIPEILITPRARPPTYYTMDAATTAFLSSRIQKWDFSQFIIPDITKRELNVVVRECSLHSDACLDISSDSEFLAVLQPSDSGSYSALGVYSLRDESLGDMLYIFHFDQNTVSVSISPSCDYIVVGYAGRGPLYRFVQPTKNIGQVLSLTRGGDKSRLVPVRELYTDSHQSALMAINCMHFLPVPGMGIVYGTNTGELVLLH